MNKVCEACAGACCEYMLIDLTEVPSEERDWLTYHGEQDGKWLKIPVSCKHLKDGKCQIYGARPIKCRECEVGSLFCRLAIRHRRSDIEKEIVKLITEN